MSSNRFPFMLALLILGLMSCSETEIIVPKAEDIQTERVVFIEDFTGVKCPNCPSATREIQQLLDRYPGNVVTVAYHTNFLGSPITEAGYESKYDFRTPDAEKLEQYMGYYLGKPAVTMNRKKYNSQDQFLLSTTAALGNIESELKSIPKVKISIENDYNESTRKLTSTITLDPQSANQGDFRLHALVTESKIIDTQDDNSTKIKNYEHNHVFRKMLSTLEGDELGAALTPGKPIVKTYEFTLPPEAGWWVARNCSVVAFVTDLNQKTNQVGAVLQAAEKHVVE